MGKRLDWSAVNRRKRRALLTNGEINAYKREAKWLAARLAKGEKSANARKSSLVRRLSEDEINSIARTNGWTVKPTTTGTETEDAPWRSAVESESGKKGLNR